MTMKSRILQNLDLVAIILVVTSFFYSLYLLIF